MPKKSKKKTTLSLKDLHKSTNTKWADDREEVPSAPSGQHLITGEDQFPERRRSTFGDGNIGRMGNDEREPLAPPRSDGDNNWRGSMGTRAPGRGRSDEGRGFSRGGFGDRDDGRGFSRGGFGDRDDGRGSSRGGFGDRDEGRGFSRGGFGDRDDGRGFSRGGFGDRDDGRGSSRGSFGGDRDGGPWRDGRRGDKDGGRDGYGSTRPQDEWNGSQKSATTSRPKLKLAPRTKALPSKQTPSAAKQTPALIKQTPAPSTTVSKSKPDPFGGAQPINNEQIFAARKAAEAKAKAEAEATQPASKPAAATDAKPSEGRWVRGGGAPGDDQGRRARHWGGSDREFARGSPDGGRGSRDAGRGSRDGGRGDRAFGRDRDREFGRSDREFGRSDREFGRSDREFGRSDREFGRSDREFGRGDRERGRRRDAPPMATNSRWSMPDRDIGGREEPPKVVDSGRFARRELPETKPNVKKERDAEKERLLDEKMKALRGGTIRVEKVQVPVHRSVGVDKAGGKQRDAEKERLLDEKIKALRGGAIKVENVQVPVQRSVGVDKAGGKQRDAEKERLLDEKMKAMKAKAMNAEKTSGGGFRTIAAPKAEPIPANVYVITAKDEENYRAVDKETIAAYNKQITSLMKEMYADRNAGMMILDDINSKIKHKSHYWQLAFTTMDIACESLRSQMDRAKEILRFLRCKTMGSQLMAKALSFFADTLDEKKMDFPKAPTYYKEMVQYAVVEGLVADIELSNKNLRCYGGLPAAGPLAEMLWSGKLGAKLVLPSGTDSVVLLTTVLEYVACKSLSSDDLVEPEEEDSETYILKAVKDEQYGSMLKAALNSGLDARTQYELVKAMVNFAEKQKFPTIGEDDSLLQTTLYSFYDLEILEDIETAAIRWFEEAKAADATCTPVTQVADFMESLMDEDEDSDE